MSHRPFASPVAAWAVLVAVTIGSLLLGTDRGIHDHDAVAAALLVVAFAKGLVVGLRFMELDHGNRMLRRALCGYVLIAGAGLASLAWLL